MSKARLSTRDLDSDCHLRQVGNEGVSDGEPVVSVLVDESFIDGHCGPYADDPRLD